MLLSAESRLSSHLLLYTAQVQVLSAALRAAQFDSVGDCETKKMEESSGKLQNKTVSDETAASDTTCSQVKEDSLSSPASQDNISDQSATSILKNAVSMHCASFVKWVPTGWSNVCVHVVPGIIDPLLS